VTTPLCVCGADRAAHREAARSTQCSHCACPWWRRDGWWRHLPWRAVASVLLRSICAAAAFAVVITAGAWAAHGAILLIAAIP
jgi:hypothetical protein